ncbi:ABC transporter [Magnetospirillum fulvum MGU-K5]|uniref:ABC transporter n=1 Tax=Magnetospirillum fulvum MGU-K5 TaxID=1316936 RepID=S9SBA0_MAGFU|nr:amino acid ABC transporter ATP-binding protein [Magnetospirillum fulvum]EPY01989.1 ABC transporter [Magnetospirillum fulvum MGU-K5]
MSEPAPPVIEFRSVTKSFGTNPVIRGIDLSVAQGEVVVICGPSGSGKSTLIRLVNRLESLSSGDILIDGNSTASYRGAALRELRTGIGFVFQQFNLYGHLTAAENIALAPRKVLGLSAQEALERARALLARVGLADKEAQYPSQLSGGQQQRVAIARALAMQPKILLFDEPTSALDPEMIGEVLAVIRQLADTGITMLVVTHEMGFAREIADRVVFIDGGVILEDAPPEQFFLATRHPRAQRFLRQLLSPLHTATE